MNKSHNIGVSARIGTYSDAVEAPGGAKWLVTSGTPGLSPEGAAPEGIVALAELAWRHMVTLLEP
jgi:enamine deaminase RidA (YjgF/YER057c/UK114 family)